MRHIDVMTGPEVTDFINRNKEKPLELSAHVIRQVNDLAAAVVEMGEHVEKSNGNVAALKAQQEIMKDDIRDIKTNQENLLSRWVQCLPGWSQKSLIVWCAISILIVPFMSGVIAILAVLMTR